MRLIFAEYFSHYAADFAFSCISTYSVKNQRHQVNGFVSTAFSRAAKVSSTLALSRRALRAAILSACNLPTEPSTRSKFFGGSSSCWNLFTPTIIRSPFQCPFAICKRSLGFLLDITFSDSFRSAANFVNLLIYSQASASILLVKAST